MMCALDAAILWSITYSIHAACAVSLAMLSLRLTIISSPDAMLGGAPASDCPWYLIRLQALKVCHCG